MTPFIHILLAGILITSGLSAKAASENDFRIQGLLPNLLIPLAVEPAVPDNFVALSPNGSPDLFEWVYWAPKGTSAKVLKDPTLLKGPILKVQLSANVIQTGSDSFSSENDLEILKNHAPEDFACIRTRWGNYPVIAVRTRMLDKVIFLAWVGLNDPQDGWTLLFNMVYPDTTGHPNKNDEDFWQNFIMNTTQLEEGDYFKALGQDLQDGYTVVKSAGAKVKMLAEKRVSDNTVRVLVIPESPHTTYQYSDMTEGRMGAQWRFGEPLVKVYGDILVEDKNFKCTINHNTSIFYKTVQEFSPLKETGKKPLVFYKQMDSGSAN